MISYWWIFLQSKWSRKLLVDFVFFFLNKLLLQYLDKKKVKRGELSQWNAALFNFSSLWNKREQIDVLHFKSFAFVKKWFILKKKKNRNKIIVIDLSFLFFFVFVNNHGTSRIKPFEVCNIWHKSAAQNLKKTRLAREE